MARFHTFGGVEPGTLEQLLLHYKYFREGRRRIPPFFMPEIRKEVKLDFRRTQ